MSEGNRKPLSADEFLALVEEVDSKQPTASRNLDDASMPADVDGVRERESTPGSEPTDEGSTTNSEPGDEDPRSKPEPTDKGSGSTTEPEPHNGENGEPSWVANSPVSLFDDEELDKLRLDDPEAPLSPPDPMVAVFDGEDDVTDDLPGAEATVVDPPRIETEATVVDPPRIDMEATIVDPPRIETEATVPDPPRIETEATIVDPPGIETEATVPDPPPIETEATIVDPPRIDMEATVVDPPRTETEVSAQSSNRFDPRGRSQSPGNTGSNANTHESEAFDDQTTAGAPAAIDDQTTAREPAAFDRQHTSEQPAGAPTQATDKAPAGFDDHQPAAMAPGFGVDSTTDPVELGFPPPPPSGAPIAEPVFPGPGSVAPEELPTVDYDDGTRVMTHSQLPSQGQRPSPEASLKRSSKKRFSSGARQNLALFGVGLLGLLVAFWGVDVGLHRDKVMSGVRLDDTAIGGMTRPQLTELIQQKTEELASEPLTIEVGGESVVTDPITLGTGIDGAAVTGAAFDARRDGFVLLRPFTWFIDRFRTTNIDLVYTYDEATTRSAVTEVVESQLESPVQPDLTFDGDALTVVAGSSGITVDAGQLISSLPPAIEGGEPYNIVADPVDLEPSLQLSSVQSLASDLNDKTSEPIDVVVLEETAALEPSTLRSWIVLDEEQTSETPQWHLDENKVQEDLRPLFHSLGNEDQLARFDIVDGKPVIIPATETVICCAEGSTERLKGAIVDATPGDEEPSSVTLESVTVGPDEGVAELESLGIIEEVSSFTTNHGCCENRVVNIHEFADRMQGTIIRPGQTLSLNDTVGQRTLEKGFLPAGALAYGKKVDDVGGGVSQYATTIFNAAFFAGLDFEEYQSHSLYFTRYPRGREATISWRAPDLKISNPTPYGILIWNTYTPTSITVTMYSTKNLDVEALPLEKSSSNYCDVYTTPRVITFDDGTTKKDSVFALYRPATGLDCNNQPTQPEG